MMSDRIYQEALLDHYKNPRNKRKLSSPSFTTDHNNPSCGDRIVMTGLVDNMHLTELCFDGSGCVISMATASMLTEHCVGKPIQEILKLSKDDILALIGINLGPTRLK